MLRQSRMHIEIIKDLVKVLNLIQLKVYNLPLFLDNYSYFFRQNKCCWESISKDSNKVLLLGTYIDLKSLTSCSEKRVPEWYIHIPQSNTAVKSSIEILVLIFI
jgi:hypothetical protein